MNKQNSDDSWDIGKFYLANGKPLSKENIDISVLMNLSNVQRAFSFAGVPPSVNLNLTSHSYLTMLIAYRLLAAFPRLKEIVSPDKVGAYAMLHDIAEALVGDIPTPLKHPAFAAFEDRVRESIFEYLGVDTTEMKKCYGLIQFADLVASVYECEYATTKGYDLSIISRGRLEKLMSTFGAPVKDYEWETREDGTYKFLFNMEAIDRFVSDITSALFGPQ